VFLTPDIVKATHHHNVELQFIHQGQGPNFLSKASKSCPICNFEFVNFIFKGASPYYYFQSISTIKKPEPVFQEYNFSFTAYLHRAPPLTFS